MLSLGTLSVFAAVSSGAAAAICNVTAADTTDYSNLTTALVRAPPPGFPLPLLSRNYTGLHFDLNATVTKAEGLIKEAASNGANLIVFPELWFPGYPVGNDNEWIQDHVAEYIDNSMVVGGPEWARLLAAAKANNIYLSLAFSEKTDQTIYMALSIVSNYGELLLHRQKVRPSGGERNIWSDGSIYDVKAIDTPYGRWGILECWEHLRPTETFPLLAQVENVHIAAAPYTPDANNSKAQSWETYEVNSAAVRTYAVNSGAVTLWAGVGYSAVYGGDGLEVAEISATVDFDEHPFLYANINTTSFDRSVTYNINGEDSWGVLKQIEDGWPYYIPKVIGTFVLKKTNLISDLLAFNASAATS